MNVTAVRVGFCEYGAGYGGAVISLEAFLKKAPEHIRPYIYTKLDTPEYRNLARFGNRRHIKPFSIIGRQKLNHLSPSLATTFDNIANLAPQVLQFYYAFKRDAIELVYLNNDPSCNLAMAIAARIAKLPCILHARGFSADTKGTRWVLSNITHCIAVSRAIKNELIGLGFPSEKCTIVPEGLETKFFYPRASSFKLREELGLTGLEPVVTLVGGLVDWKGQDVLLDASPYIFKEFPNTHILIVGSAYGSSDHYARMLQEKVAKSEYHGQIRLLGARADVPDILSISSVVLHTSIKPEPFGRTFLEGMAMGKAVIASNEGGPVEVIENEIDGLLIEPRHPQRLAESINRLLRDPKFANTLGGNAAKKAAFYSIENHSASIVNVIECVMQKSLYGRKPHAH